MVSDERSELVILLLHSIQPHLLLRREIPFLDTARTESLRVYPPRQIVISLRRILHPGLRMMLSNRRDNWTPRVLKRSSAEEEDGLCLKV